MRYAIIVLLLLATVMPTPQAAMSKKPLVTIIEMNSGNMLTPGYTYVRELHKVWIRGFWTVEIRIIGYRPHPLTRQLMPVFGPVNVWVPGHYEWRWITVRVPSI